LGAPTSPETVGFQFHRFANGANSLPWSTLGGTWELDGIGVLFKVAQSDLTLRFFFGQALVFLFRDLWFPESKAF